MIHQKKWQFPSCDGTHPLWCITYEPEGEIRGIVQVVHGMTDYTLRYDDLLTALAESGYVAFGFDLLGHGHTAKDRCELGFFAKEKGWQLLVDDVFYMGQAVREEYGKELPFALLGHSMGSFICRLAALKEPSPDRLILIGSGGLDVAAPVGNLLAKGIGAVRGKKHISFFLQGLVFGDYDKKFPEEYKNRWITVDTENLIRYKDDPFCTFRFSVSAISDLITLHQKANSRTFFRTLSDETKVLLLSGEDDPVGNYGKGVLQVQRRLEKAGKRSEAVLYPGFRHEILQDFCKEEVTQKILSFLE